MKHSGNSHLKGFNKKKHVFKKIKIDDVYAYVSRRNGMRLVILNLTSLNLILILCLLFATYFV